jgi:dolichyl-phosphate beta-glucosyltransferase
VTDNFTVSIVIPAFNESGRILATLEAVVGCIRAHAWRAEVVVVNDGSTDRTAEVVRGFQAEAPEVKLIENPGNRGKGYSVRNGVLNALGRIILFTDADLSAPIEEAPRLLGALDAGADIAIGSRWLRAETQTERQPLHRQLFGRIFNLMLRVSLGLQFADTQCGFKAFKRAAAQAIFPLQRIERWGFDPEILFLARKLGFKVEEVPVLWGHSGGARINPVIDGARMFQEMLRVRWYSLNGEYDAAGAAARPEAAALRETPTKIRNH